MDYRAIVENINGVPLLRLPMEISRSLPSRGMVMVAGSLNGKSCVLPAEPDGRGGHFLALDREQAAFFGLETGKRAALQLAPAADWPEPALPEDLEQAIASAGLRDAWDSLTVKARWEWLRWIRGTNNGATRQKRVAVAVDKLRKGDRRPCCFNAAGCTVPAVSKSGVLLD